MVRSRALEDVYGEASAAQLARYEAAIESFRGAYGAAPAFLFRAPGRVNLIGEHTDYNQGFVLPVALDRDILLLSRPRADRTIRLDNLEARYGPREFALDRDIPPGRPGDWSNYARGAAQMVAQQVGTRATGMDGLVVGAPPFGVPRGAGLSSSSALTVVCAVALAHLNHWQPDRSEFARLCSEAEWYVGTRGGIMDQFIALLAARDRALFLDCRPSPTGEYSFERVQLPEGYRLIVVDSGVHHANAQNEFNLRVAACRAAVACLRATFPRVKHLRDVQNLGWAEIADELPISMTVSEAQARGADLDNVPLPSGIAPLRVRACCRHVHSENERVLATVAALDRGDIEAVGRLLVEAHASARDDYQISCREIETLVDAACSTAGVLGARLTGAGWGGCVVALVADEAVCAFEAHVLRSYHIETGLQATVFPCRAGGPAGLVARL